MSAPSLLDLLREPRPLLGLRAPPSSSLRASASTVSPNSSVGIVDEIGELRVETRARSSSLEPRLREQQRAVVREHGAVQLDRLIPELAPLECERAGLGQRDLVELRALLGLREPVRGFARARPQRERGLELALARRR